MGDSAPRRKSRVQEEARARGLSVVGDPSGRLDYNPDAFVADELAKLAAERGLMFPRPVLASLVAALDSGKHVMLTGAPGTGKTSLAFLVAELAKQTARCTGHLAATATTEWDTSETIGRYHDTPEGPVFKDGLFLEAIRRGRWLIVDELNRADFDKAFGPMFTVLTDQAVVLPFKRVGHSSFLSLVPAGVEAPARTEPIKVPKRWRIIATMNDFDKDTLYRMSFALMRRFAFIHVDPPDDETMTKLMGGADQIVNDLLVLSHHVDLGAALFIEAARYARRRTEDGDASRSRVLLETFYGFFLRQLHLIDKEQLESLFSDLAPLFDPPELDRLRQVLGEVVVEGPAASLHAVEPAAAELGGH